MVQRATGTYRDGHVELDAPVDWKDGMRVSVESEKDRIGMDESEWPTTPEGLAKLIAQIDAIEPLELTELEIAEIEAAQKEFGEYSIQGVKKQMGL